MKKSTLILTLTLFSIQVSFCQYLETFSIPNKGLLGGPCGSNDPTTCGSFDFSGVDWTINGNFTGFDGDDIMATNSSGVLFIGGDIDEEMCVETPVLDISTVAGAASLAVDIEWIHHDNAEYVDVNYSVDGGAFVTIPNQFGGNTPTHTVDFGGSGNNGSGTVTLSGIFGSTLVIQVCADSNTASSGEAHTVDNISVPEAGAMILPVTWGNMNASATDRGNLIQWSTASEVNNESFEIQKRHENENEFYTIGEISGQVNSYRENKYDFLDEDILGGNAYYRIKQNDLDGHFSYSDIVSIKNEKETIFSSYPNPFSNEVTIAFENDNTHPFDIQIIDSFGRLVLVQTVQNGRTLRIETTDLNSGIYFLKNDLNNDTHVLFKE